MARVQEKPRRKARGPAYDDLPDMCTVRQTGAYLQTSRNTTYDLIQRGVIPSVRFGKLIRVPKAALRSANAPL